MLKTITKASFVGASLLLSVDAASAANAPGASDPSRAPQAVPTGQVNRYTIPHYYSVFSGAGRSFTAVTIKNNASVTCSAAVAFQKAAGTTDTCVVNQAIPAGQSRAFCSRIPGSFGAYDCVTGASCAPALTFDEGHAFVSSTNSSACANIAVDAEVIYTTSAADDVITGLTKLSVVKFGTANLGD